MIDPIQAHNSAFQTDTFTGETLSSNLRRLVEAIHSLGALDSEELRRAAQKLSVRESTEGVRRIVESFGPLTAQIEALHQARKEVLSERREVTRRPHSTEPQKIRLDNITVVTKLSKVEYDIQNRGVSYETLLQQYRQEGLNWEDIVASHVRQQESLEAMRRLLPEARFLSRNEVTTPLVQSSDLVIALGGDDHFKHVSHCVTTGFFVGVNSDPATSVGALTSTTVEGLPSLLQSLSKGEFVVEEWSRLEISVNGNNLPPSCSEIFVGEEESILTTRARGVLGDEKFFIKGSGLLISTGAGSTGWFRAASQHLFHGEHLWLRTDRHGEFVSREPYGDVASFALAKLHGRLEPGQELEIVSSSNHHPIVSADSLVTVHFLRGQRAIVRMSEFPLKIVVPVV